MFISFKINIPTVMTSILFFAYLCTHNKLVLPLRFHYMPARLKLFTIATDSAVRPSA